MPDIRQGEPMTELRLGPPMVFVPVLQTASDYDGRPLPLGYVRVETVGECPICVRQERRDAGTDEDGGATNPD